MRITIDYTPALRQSAGIGRYTRGLVAALAETDHQNQYTLFVAGRAPEAGNWPPNFTVRSSRIPSRWLSAGWYRLRMQIPAESLSGGCDVYHSPDFALPPLRQARGVVTVHDLSFLRLPECADPRLRAFLTRAVPEAVERARRVLADSENTRQDLVELLAVSPDKISVITPAVEGRFQPVHDTAKLEEIRTRYHLPRWFILSVGTLEPRKNFAGLISAYAQLRRQTGLPHGLVIAGKEGWLYQDIYDRVTKEGLQDCVLFPGFVADEDLPGLYSLADLLAFPSLYEGFGIPPLEAMACGTPVVTSRNSSLLEVVGSAALLVDPNDVDALAESMARVLGNAKLRLRLSDLGRAQAERFSWHNAARSLVEAYAQALADSEH